MSEERDPRLGVKVSDAEVSPSTKACPACGVSWEGEEIPAEDRHVYVTARWMRQLACYDRGRDRVTHYICPDCGEHFRRKGT